MIEFILTMLALGVAGFVQNMAFTAVSRSRNSGDPAYHRWCAYASNGIWFFCQLLIWKTVWGAVEAGAWWQIGVAAVVYVLATTEGSVTMMRHMLKTESGKRRVGARS